MKKIISLLLSVVFVFSVLSVVSSAKTSVVADGIVEISKYGNVKINLSHSAVYALFELGDIVTVSFGETSIDVPLCVSFSDVDSGCDGLFCQISSDGAEETELAVNTGNFAEKYGIAEKTVFPDKTYIWEYQNGFSQATKFEISLKEKAGYLEEFTVRNIESSNNREDYPDLTDEQYANFRAVTAGRIAKGILYRSASPVDPTINRNLYADSICRKYKITHFINLADSEDILSTYEGYNDSYYSTVEHIAVAASMNPADDENKSKFAECYRYIIENPQGRFDVHCREGKERSGMFVAIAECLMGATYDEIVTDYMISYINFCGVNAGDEAYTIIANGNIRKTLTDVFGADPKTANLEKEAEEYLTDIGLTQAEISSLKLILSGNGKTYSIINTIYRIISEILPQIFDFFKSVFGNIF